LPVPLLPDVPLADEEPESEVAIQPVSQLPISSGALTLTTAAGVPAVSADVLLHASSSTAVVTAKVVFIFFG